MYATRTVTRPVFQPLLGALIALSALVLLWSVQARAQPSDFVGTYTGSAEVIAADGSKIPRDMSVEISESTHGFRVQWTSVTYRTDGEAREKSYEVDFFPSSRPSVYAAAQRKNMFGKEVQLDPMKGEPYVWASIADKTLTVYSLFVGPDGGYSLQQYDRTLADGGLELRFQTIRDGEIQRAVETFLARQ